MNPFEKAKNLTIRVAAHVGEVVLDALDCFGDDPVEDAEIRSEIWDKQESN